MHPDYLTQAGRPAFSPTSRPVLSDTDDDDRQVFSLRVMAMYSVSFTQHTLECSVIALGVRGKPFVGEERRRVQKLCVGLDRSLLEVVGVGLITCAKVGLVRQVHALFVRSALQVVCELQVREEVEGVRQEVREVKGESKVEESRSLHERMWMR